MWNKFVYILFILFASCAPTLPSSFTSENIMKIHSGMGSDEIVNLFGQPKTIRSAVCGREPNQWACTTWEYGEFPYTTASFTFAGEYGSYILNNFEVKRQ